MARLYCGVRSATSRSPNVCHRSDIDQSSVLTSTRALTETALRRHGYYCRSRKGVAPVKIRSCTPCTKAKVRCDRSQPACSRCTKTGSVCQYPPSSMVPARSSESPRTNAETSFIAGPGTTSPGPNATGTVTEEVIQRELDELFVLSNQLPKETLDLATWGLDSVESPYVPSTSVADVSFSPNEFQTSAFPGSIMPEQKLRARHPFDNSIPSVPSPDYRSIVQRPRIQLGSNRTARYIFDTLQSYPFMLRRGHLPPFVHESMVSSDLESIELLPLMNCINLMRMVGGGVQGSRRLFWRNARQECERLYHEVGTDEH